MKKMENICRLCLQKEESMFSIFSFKNKNLRSQIMNCCSIEISENDILPKLICIACIKKLEAFHEFKKKCKQSDYVLREHYKMEFNVGFNLNNIKIYQDAYVQTDMINAALQMENPSLFTQVNKIEKENDFNMYLNTNDNYNQDDNPTISFKYSDPVVSSTSDSQNSFEIDDKPKLEYNWTPDIEDLETTGIRKSNRLKNKQIFTCNLCQKEYTSKEALFEHAKFHINEKSTKHKRNRKFKCKICKISFNKKHKLNLHLKIHGISSIKNKKQYICDVCSKSFISKSGLIRHIKLHSSSRPYACQFCNKTFIILSYKKRHERTHNNSKDLVCHICSATYSSLNGFRYHLKVHTGEANYPCQVCGKSFRKKRYLKEHTFTHTGEKPFVCKICGSAYANSGTLFGHEKKCKSKHNNTVSVRKEKSK
ncbi:zinc finger protein OZF-like isoform X2 [Vespula squamosa]|uniref:Zinc finger protein OZF-like isoform X2 n=1 Tax=Vespula squamosa TaxID=30214 RepID=A0ABD2B1H4_VESSQ